MKTNRTQQTAPKLKLSDILRRTAFFIVTAFLGSMIVLGASLLVLKFARAGDEPMKDGPTMIWPISGSLDPDTDLVSSPFGPRWQISQDRYDYHPGLDIAAPQGTPIHAAAEGNVFRVGWLSESAGLSVILYHPELDLFTAYLHLDSTSIDKGQSVNQGDIIGYVGDSGITSFDHLHFEVRLSASDYPTSTRNPMAYLPRPDNTTPTLYLTDLQTDNIFNPLVSLVVTTTRAELDINEIRLTIENQATGTVVDDQLVNFNERLQTGSDTLNENGIKIIPSQFNTSTNEYELEVEFYQLRGVDVFTLTAQVVDLAGNVETLMIVSDDPRYPQSSSVTSRKIFQPGQPLPSSDSSISGFRQTWAACASIPISHNLILRVADNRRF